MLIIKPTKDQTNNTFLIKYVLWMMGSCSSLYFVIGTELFPAGRKAPNHRFVKPPFLVAVKAVYRLFPVRR